MTVRIYRRERIRAAAAMGLCIILAAAGLCYPQAIATGVSRGLSVCTTVIIPTLYPFMVLSGFVAASPLCRRVGRLSSAVMRWLFGLPPCCAAAMLISFIGGYPAGAIALSSLYQQSLITKEQLHRCVRFCVNAGPGFIISAVGVGLMGNVTAGILLYIAHIAASVIIGVASAGGHRRQKTAARLASTAEDTPADIVRDTCQSLLTMCGYVVLAATVLSLWDATRLAAVIQQFIGIPAASMTAVLSAITEVSCGCIALAGRYPAAPFVISMCLGWGGLSVQGQLGALLGDSLRGCAWRQWRLVHGVLSGALAMALFRVFPAATLTASGDAAIHADLFSVSATASVMLLLLSFLAMCLFSAKKTGNRKQNVIH